MAGGDAGPVALRGVREFPGRALSRYVPRRRRFLPRRHAGRSKVDRLAVLRTEDFEASPSLHCPGIPTPS
jgi:hypothetical protein